MTSPLTILIIDDDDDDQYLIQMAFEADSGQYQFQMVNDGNELLNTGIKADPLPDLIFLDLNMPRISGFEVLTYLKQSPLYQHIPVIVLSTSNDEQDINRCYKSGANTYLVKPTTHQDLLRLVGIVRLYWFSLARRPTSKN